LVSRNRTVGVLCLGRLHDNPFTGDEVDFVRQVAAQVAIAVENALTYRQIAELKDKLAQEKLYLEDEIRSQMNFDSIIASTVLIHGETGVGKEGKEGVHPRSSVRGSTSTLLPYKPT
jgi:formate hydrogenlyase transcriptional activator